MEHRHGNWKCLLKKNARLILPSASDALTAKLNEHAGFPAYQIGGFALLQFEKIVDIAYWKSIEQKAVPLGERVRLAINKIVKAS